MAAKPPDAFLSYTRFDDRLGAIRTFRQWLSDIVREVSGEPFDIFQDVDDIDVGQRWSGKLLREADPMAMVLSSRQRYDWRELRHSSFRNRKVRLKIEELARQIDRARQRVMSGTAATSPLQESAGVDQPIAQPSPPPPSPEDLEVFRGRMATIRRSLGVQQDSGEREHRTESFEPGAVFRDKDAPWCPEMVVIPPGEFMMGSTEAECEWAVEQGTGREWVEAEKPQHPVRIAHSLAVGRFPVTFEQYDHFARTAGRGKPDDRGWGRGHMPVINVSWDDATAYVAWLSVQTGQRYRLLSEAEWEYVCRARTTTRYWWGDEITPENANYGGNIGRTREVGSYPSNLFGLYDMHGNVWEWCEDCWNDSYQGAPDDGGAWTSGDCGGRVLRGGSWNNLPVILRSADRVGYTSGGRDVDAGFRVARTLSRSESVSS